MPTVIAEDDLLMADILEHGVSLSQVTANGRAFAGGDSPSITHPLKRRLQGTVG